METVALRLFKFLLWYLPLILAFSFSFYKLYHKENPSEGKSVTFHVGNKSGNFSVPDDDVDYYRYLAMSLLTTVVILIGEVDASKMSFDNWSYVVFLFFVFMMALLSTNVLIGLAVDDMKGLLNNAELVACKSRLKLVHHFESVVFGEHLLSCRSCQPTGGFFSLCCGWRGSLQEKISLFPDMFQKGYLSIVLNDGKRCTNLKLEKFDSKSEIRPNTCFSLGKYRMVLDVDRKMLTAAKNIACRRNMQSLS
jgi:hypothetical protein